LNCAISDIGEGPAVGDEDIGDGAGEGFGDMEGEVFFFFLSEESFFIFLDSFFLSDFEELLEVREPFLPEVAAAAATKRSGDEVKAAGVLLTDVEEWVIVASGGSD